MKATKKFRPMNLSMTSLTIILLLCSLIILPAGSGSKLLAAQPGGASQAADAALIQDSRIIEETKGSAANLSPLRSDANRNQDQAGETAVELLTCNGTPVAFEGGIPSNWSVDQWIGPVYWSTTDNLSACDNGGNLTLGSGKAACADSDTTNTGGDSYDTELFSNSFDLTGRDEVNLQFAAFYNDIDAVDLFEVWVWDYGVGTLALQWNTDQNKIAEIDLTPYKGSADIKVSFRYHGDSWDWYAQVDDVQLSCSGPNINVDPLAIGSTQELDSVTTHPLDIENVGTANLDWSIVEDSLPPAADVCDTPEDLPWASVAPDSGTTAPGGTTSVDVTYDATGMAPGTYGGLLCVDSNDPDPGPGNETERVIVVLEMVVEAPPPPDHDDFDTPREIDPLPYGDITNTAGATTAADDPVIPCISGQGAHSVWYHFSTKVPGILTVRTNGSSYDTVMAIWTGDRGSLVNAACDDDGGDGFRSLIKLPVVDNVDYYVEIVGFSSNDYGTLKFIAQFVSDVRGSTPAGRAGQAGTQLGQGTADISVQRQPKKNSPAP